MKMLKKICGVLVTLILICLLALAVVLILPRFLGYDTMAVLSGSMEPEIPVGSVVFAKETDPTTLETGDVITYEIGNGTRVTHRIVKINSEEQTFVTKGDANDVEDGAAVAYHQVVGKVKLQLPYVGYISIYIKTPLGIAVVCGVLDVLILLIFLPDILSGGSGKKKKEKKTDSDMTDM